MELHVIVNLDRFKSTQDASSTNVVTDLFIERKNTRKMKKMQVPSRARHTSWNPITLIRVNINPSRGQLTGNRPTTSWGSLIPYDSTNNSKEGEFQFWLDYNLHDNSNALFKNFWYFNQARWYRISATQKYWQQGKKEKFTIGKLKSSCL